MVAIPPVSGGGNHCAARRACDTPESRAGPYDLRAERRLWMRSTRTHS